MTDGEDPDVVAMRERAERVMARRAQERAEGKGPAPEEPEGKPKKTGRRWYHWVIDGALLLAAAYLVKTRFFDKPAEPPAKPATSASASPSASTSAVTSAVPLTKGSAELRAGPGPMFATVESIPPNTRVEVLEVSSAGFVKVSTPTGKSGWVPSDSITVGH